MEIGTIGVGGVKTKLTCRDSIAHLHKYKAVAIVSPWDHQGTLFAQVLCRIKVSTAQCKRHYYKTIIRPIFTYRRENWTHTRSAEDLFDCERSSTRRHRMVSDTTMNCQQPCTGLSIVDVCIVYTKLQLPGSQDREPVSETMFYKILKTFCE